MSNGIIIDNAEKVLRDKVAEASRNEPAMFLSTLEGFKRFAQTQFDVPDSPDSDGCLIEYGVFGASKTPEFQVHLARQFEQLDEDGDHETYIQTGCDLAFSLDDELKAFEHQAQWWFRSDDGNFNAWWAQQTSLPVMQLLSRRTPQSIEFAHDVV
ncbi:hypothetical protein FQN54_005022 [Arachnomyces sp. PD_36]|nr:hypothetical protein FQN54_005022 [Arachnomyces sp. PD_36]